MRQIRMALAALAGVLCLGASASAQLQYSVQSVTQVYQPYPNGHFQGGFDATVQYRNINRYTDPEIIAFNTFNVQVSQRVRDYCSLYTDQWGCNIIIARAPNNHNAIIPQVIGNVQTDSIPIAGSSFVFFSNLVENSCLGNCWTRRYWFGGYPRGFYFFGCQAPYPEVGYYTEYAGRTCDADGYDGSLSVDVQFRIYTEVPNAPQMIFTNSDVEIVTHNDVLAGPSVFVQVTPEPATWLLTASGLVGIGLVARQRKHAGRASASR